MVTLVSSVDILGLRTRMKCVGRSFIQMKRKGVDYYPVIMRYATVKRELAQDRCMITCVEFGQDFFWANAPPPPNPPRQKLPIRLCVLLLNGCACLSDAHSDFNTESG